MRTVKKKTLLLAIFCAVFSGTLAFLSAKNPESVSAVDASGFQAGNIMSDLVMSDYNSMTQAEIQSFLSSKVSCNQSAAASAVGAYNVENVSTTVNGVYYNRRYYFYYWENGVRKSTSDLYHVENNQFVCLPNEKFNGETAAFIIWEAAQAYKINPKVLIVLLEKEQGLITDKFPRQVQYRSATGYGCPDTAACDSKYYGFKNQVGLAASLFHTVLTGGWTNFPLGNNSVLYNKNTSCGSSVVNIQNLATSALYRYTPYQPNAAALRAGYGSGDSCSSYGNRNFYLYFTEWFGSTQVSVPTSKISSAYNNLKSNGTAVKTLLGNSVGSIAWNSRTGAFWQAYQNGFIVGSEKTGYFESLGKIRTVWQKFGFEGGKFGFPTGSIASNSKTGILWQTYQNGLIVGNDTYGYYDSMGGIRSAWQRMGFESGKMGFPTAFIASNSRTGASWQQYQNGFIIGSDKTGYFESMGGIRTAWQKLGFEGGSLGFPTSSILSNTKTGISWQVYQNGLIVGSDKTGYFESSGKIREYWAKNGFESGKFGFPTSVVYNKNGVLSQSYQKGTIQYDTKTGVVSSS